MKHCCDHGQPPHTGGDPDPIVLPQCCSVALAFILEDTGAQKELKTFHKNHYKLDLMHSVLCFCVSLQSVVIQDCWFATALLVQAPVVHLSA